jgi:hypothetical protein
LNETPGKRAISLDNLLMAGRRKDNTHTQPVRILQPEKNRLSTIRRRQAQSLQIASLTMYVAPVDAPWSSGSASGDLVHS